MVISDAERASDKNTVSTRNDKLSANQKQQLSPPDEGLLKHLQPRPHWTVND